MENNTSTVSRHTAVGVGICLEETSSIRQTAGLEKLRNPCIRSPSMTGMKGGRMYADYWVLRPWRQTVRGF